MDGHIVIVIVFGVNRLIPTLSYQVKNFLTESSEQRVKSSLTKLSVCQKLLHVWTYKRAWDLRTMYERMISRKKEYISVCYSHKAITCPQKIETCYDYFWGLLGAWCNKWHISTIYMKKIKIKHQLIASRCTNRNAVSWGLVTVCQQDKRTSQQCVKTLRVCSAVKKLHCSSLE